MTLAPAFGGPVSAALETTCRARGKEIGALDPIAAEQRSVLSSRNAEPFENGTRDCEP